MFARPIVAYTVIRICLYLSKDLRVGVVNDSEVSVMEGQTATVCAAISSPEEVDRSVLLLARTIPGTAIGEWDGTKWL